MNSKPGLNTTTTSSYKQALIISQFENLSWSLPSLLSRAGFVVDVYTQAKILKKSKLARKVVLNREPLTAADIEKLICQENYDWIVIADDGVLQTILTSKLTEEIKNKILPVCEAKHRYHLLSKINLSKLFQANGINTPRFYVIHHLIEAIKAAKELGFPLLLKVDCSSGGAGVYQCNNARDILQLPISTIKFPLLAQEKIVGDIVDLSALYFSGKLIHFTYSKFIKTNHGEFGPSIIRDYVPLKALPKNIFLELQQIGQTLGAHGFVNITCVETPAKQRYYFEADMRPNAWVDYSRYLGDDLAPRIKAWFDSGAVLSETELQADATQMPKRIPHFLRMSFWDILLNRGKVWQYLTFEDRALILMMIFRKIKPALNL